MHSNEETKRADERHVFAAFLRCAPWVNIGEHNFRNGNPPHEPDIVADRDGQYIGVEITGLDLPNLRAQESVESKAVDHARRTYEAAGGPYIEVKVRGLKIDDHKMISAVGEALALLASTNLPQAGESRVAPWEEPNPALADALDSISISRPVDLPRSYWNVGRARFVPSVSSTDIQLYIDRKNPKTKLYQTRYRERWLLLNGTHFASWGELTPECREARYISSFERVFFLGAFGDPTVTELRIY